MAGSWVMVGTATTSSSNEEYEIWWNTSTGEVRAGGVYSNGEHTPNTGNSAGNAPNQSEAFLKGRTFIAVR